MIACVCAGCDDPSTQTTRDAVIDANFVSDWKLRDGRIVDFNYHPADGPPNRWDFEPAEISDAGADAETDAETPWSDMAPFEPYPLTIETGRRVAAMDMFMRACINLLIPNDDKVALASIYHPTLLYVANLLRPGTESWRKIPLACERHLGDCAEFLRCAGVAMFQDCDLNDAVGKPYRCLPGHRAMQCISNYDTGFAQIIHCPDYGGTCTPLPERAVAVEFGTDFGACQYGACSEEEDTTYRSRCIGPHAFGYCDGYYWKAYSCDIHYGFLNMLDFATVVGARDYCRLQEGQSWHCSGGGAVCPTDWRGFCADEDTYVDCADGRYGHLRCPDVIEGAYCVEDRGDGIAACVTGEEDCYDDAAVRCEGELLSLCYGHHRVRIDCAAMGMRCDPTASDVEGPICVL